MLTLRISPEELKDLNYERDHYPVAKIRIRFIILPAGQGIDKATVAQHTGVHTNTVRTCIRLYNHGGLESIKNCITKGENRGWPMSRRPLNSTFVTIRPKRPGRRLHPSTH